MSVLTQASRQLFTRAPEERFPDMESLLNFAKEAKEQSVERWALPGELQPHASGGWLGFQVKDELIGMNAWSFAQTCRWARVPTETLQRLQPATAAQVLRETLPVSRKPAQLLIEDGVARSIHTSAYTRLWDADLIKTVMEAAPEFRPPQVGLNGATGLYSGGEQDTFMFLIDPKGWVEIEGENFAPGFFVSNSETGARSLSVQTFFFQESCRNHIVHGVRDVESFTIRHTLKIENALDDVRTILGNLAKKRDSLRDSFVEVLKKAASTMLGDKAEDVHKAIGRGLPKNLIDEALLLCTREGRRFSIWNIVEALTRLNRELVYIADRTDADRMSSALFALAA